MKISAVIFDCDGTLVDSLGNALESFNFALAQVGEPPRTPEQIKKYFGAAADRILTKVIGDEALGLKAFEFYVDHQSGLAKQTKLFPGIRELLETLRARGILMAVVTGRHERDLEVVLRPHDVHAYFSTLVADNQLPHSKPAPDGILLAAERLGVDPRHTAYVGDSTVDMEAARSAGAAPVAALWDQLAKPEALGAYSPTLMARDPKDILKLF